MSNFKNHLITAGTGIGAAAIALTTLAIIQSGLSPLVTGLSCLAAAAGTGALTGVAIKRLDKNVDGHSYGRSIVATLLMAGIGSATVLLPLPLVQSEQKVSFSEPAPLTQKFAATNPIKKVSAETDAIQKQLLQLLESACDIQPYQDGGIDFPVYKNCIMRI